MISKQLILTLCLFAGMATPAAAITMQATYTGTVQQNPSGGPSQWFGDPLGMFGGINLHNKPFELRYVTDFDSGNTEVHFTIAGVEAAYVPGATGGFEYLPTGVGTSSPTPSALSSFGGEGFFKYQVEHAVECANGVIALPYCVGYGGWTLYTVTTQGWLQFETYQNVAFVTAVPAPWTALLLSTGLVTLWGLRRASGNPRRLDDAAVPRHKQSEVVGLLIHPSA